MEKDKLMHTKLWDLICFLMRKGNDGIDVTRSFSHKRSVPATDRPAIRRVEFEEGGME